MLWSQIRHLPMPPLPISPSRKLGLLREQYHEAVMSHWMDRPLSWGWTTKPMTATELKIREQEATRRLVASQQRFVKPIIDTYFAALEKHMLDLMLYGTAVTFIPDHKPGSINYLPAGDKWRPCYPIDISPLRAYPKHIYPVSINLTPTEKEDTMPMQPHLFGGYTKDDIRRAADIIGKSFDWTTVPNGWNYWNEVRTQLRSVANNAVTYEERIAKDRAKADRTMRERTEREVQEAAARRQEETRGYTIRVQKGGKTSWLHSTFGLDGQPGFTDWRPMDMHLFATAKSARLAAIAFMAGEAEEERRTFNSEVRIQLFRVDGCSHAQQVS